MQPAQPAQAPTPGIAPAVPASACLQAVGLEACAGSLVRLDVSDNALTELDGLAALTKLKWLAAVGNKVASAEPLRDMEVLEVGGLAAAG